jgi:transcriptional regulator with XRE-family HTH domain
MGLTKNIAYRIRTLREASGLSQQEVADRADLSLSLVEKLEQGRKADPRASTLLALASAMSVRPGQLIEDLTVPPEGAFPPKGKKGKKKQKKLLAALAGESSNGPVVAGTTDTTASPATNGLSVVPDALGIATAEGEPKPKRKKRR